MFERYTDKARRVIFFARYEASQFGSPYIETEHLLLGILREDKRLANRFLRSPASVESIRKQIEGHTTTGEKTSSVDIPLSNEGKRVLAYAAEEAENLENKHIGTEHLFLGLLREEKCFAAEILVERGLRLSVVRDELARSPHQDVRPSAANDSGILFEFSRDLTRAAIDNKLDPLIGRVDELRAVIEVLCNSTRNSPVLIGESGVGKTAVVEGLAQQIADGEVPTFLAEKRILALDVSLIIAGTKYRGQYEERWKTIIKELVESQNCIVFIQELTMLVGAGSIEGSLDAANILRSALSRAEIQCIIEATPSGYENTIRRIPWFARCSRPVNIHPLNEAETLAVLYGLKERYEKYHAVSYTDEALEYAAQHSGGYIPKAIDMLDTAGTRVKLRQTSLPEEVTETQKRIKFIVHRMETSIANHEFEKARFYSDEERKERDNLRGLRERHHLDEVLVGVVGREDIERIVSGWESLSVLHGGGESESGAPLVEEKTPGHPAIASASTIEKGESSLPVWDVFICHASEDKNAIARPLADALQNQGMKVWYDDFSLKLGDMLRQAIDYGLANSRYGVIILSPNFFAKHWPAHELNGLAAREVKGKKVILPIWYQIGFDEVRTQSPMLAERVAASFDKGLEYVVNQIVEVIK